MEFAIQLSSDYPDKSYGGDRVYRDMIEQAVLADRLGFDAVSITEHHLMNVLMMPAPLIFATKIAAHTKRIKILTSIVVLPLHDMRSFAGEIVVADIFTEGRLMLGVGRGAFKTEMEAMGVPMDETQDRFNESLDVLQKLLTQEDVSYHGNYYNFPPLTVMPRPVRPINMMMAVMNPDGIHACTKRGFHIQTTPLAGNHQLLVDLVSAFTRARDEMGPVGQHLTLTLSRVAHLARTPAERQQKLDAAEYYYSKFDNVFTGPGLIEAGMARPLPRAQSQSDLADSLLICTPQEMIDKLGPYADLGINRVILNVNFGLEQQATLDMLHHFAADVMPHFTNRPAVVTPDPRTKEPAT